MRYEEPSSMVRWDSPLFTLPWDEDILAIDAIWKTVSQGEAPRANQGTTVVIRALY